MAKEVLELEVKSDIKTAAKDMETLSENTATAAKRNEQLTKSTGMGTLAFRRLKDGVLALGTALKAIGVGILIAAFVALQEALSRNQKVMDTVNTIMTTISTTFNQVIDVLVDTYNWVTKSTERFNGLGKVLGGLLTIFINPLKLSFYQIKLAIQVAELAWKNSFLGGKGKDVERIAELRKGITETGEAIADTVKSTINAGKDIITNFGDAVGEIGAIGEMVVDGISKVSIKANHEQAKSTVAAQNSAKLAEAALQGLIEKNDLLAEKQRQIRDDETKTFAERIEANKQLGEVLNQQEVDMLALADTRVAAAAFELEQNKGNIDLQIAYQQTLNDRAGVEAQVAGFRSEQLTNQVSLEKELGETQKEILAEGLRGMARELQELESSYELRLEMARKAGMETTAITEQYEKEQDVIRKSYGERLLELQQGNSLALIEDLKERALASLEIEKQKELDSIEGLEDELELKAAINEKYRLSQAEIELKAAQELADKKKAIQQQMLSNITSIISSNLDAQSSTLEKNYNQEKELAEANGKSTEKIEEKYEAKRNALAEKQKKVKIGLATIDMFSSVIAAYNQGMSVPPPAGLVLAPVSAGLALAAGLANINSIMKADVGSGGGGGAPSGGAEGATPPAPQMMSGEFQLGGGIEPEPVKAFVVTDEMSSSQNQLANIRRQATI